jgi:two-component system chemotaxis response regulator CheY
VSLKVLVVDDSRIMLKKMALMLTKMRHQVVATADTGRMAIDEYARAQPDLVTMDISMPEMDGIEATGLIMEKYPEARILMVTAMGQQQMVLEAMQKGASGYVLKPVEETKLASAIANVMKKKTEVRW